jgi:hypothetical protein
MLEILMATSLDCGMELMECQSDWVHISNL